MTDSQSNGASKGGTPRLEGIALSASITATDLQKSVHWYRDVFGFVVEQEYEWEGVVAAVALKAGSARIVLGQDDGKKGWDRKKGEGMALMITTSQNVDELARGIEKRGGVLNEQPEDMPWGPRMFSVRDPEGIRIVVSSG